MRNPIALFVAKSSNGRLKRIMGKMKYDLAPLKELERRTKAGEIAPLVSVGHDSAWTRFWMPLLNGRVIRAAKRQLRLREKLMGPHGGMQSDNLAELCVVLRKVYGSRGSLIAQIRDEDDMYAVLLAFSRWYDIDDSGVFDAVVEWSGHWPEEDLQQITEVKSIGRFAAIAAKVKVSGNGGSQEERPTKWRLRDIVYLLVASVPVAVFFWKLFKIVKRWL